MDDRRTFLKAEVFHGAEFVRLKELPLLLQISRSTLLRMVARDEFPQPVYIRPNIKRWVTDALVDWLITMEGGDT